MSTGGDSPGVSPFTGTPTKTHINWSGVTWPSTAGAIKRVTNLTINQGGQLIKFKGDTDIYPSVIANVNNDPSINITTADVATIVAFITGVSGTFVAVHNDANQITGGATQFSCVNAVFETWTDTGPHAQFGSVTASWQMYSPDGVTNPMTMTSV
jgi:hypothetical protein